MHPDSVSGVCVCFFLAASFRELRQNAAITACDGRSRRLKLGSFVLAALYLSSKTCRILEQNLTFRFVIPAAPPLTHQIPLKATPKFLTTPIQPRRNLCKSRLKPLKPLSKPGRVEPRWPQAQSLFQEIHATGMEPNVITLNAVASSMETRHYAGFGFTTGVYHPIKSPCSNGSGLIRDPFGLDAGQLFCHSSGFEVDRP